MTAVGDAPGIHPCEVVGPCPKRMPGPDDVDRTIAVMHDQNASLPGARIGHENRVVRSSVSVEVPALIERVEAQTHRVP